MEALPMDLSQLFSLVTFLSTLTALLLYFIISPLLSPYFIKSYSSWSKNSQNYWNTIPYAIIHSVVVVPLSILALLGVDDSIPFKHYIMFNSNLAMICMQFSLGFFVGDFLAMSSDSYLRTHRMMVFHHISGILSVSLGLVYNGCYGVLILIRLTTELSTPFVNLRWLLAETKVPKSSPVYVTIGLAMTVTFYCSRIFTIPFLWYLFYHFLMYEQLPNAFYYSPFPAKCWTGVASVVFDTFNCYWAYKIGMGFKKHFMPGGKRN